MDVTITNEPSTKKEKNLNQQFKAILFVWMNQKNEQWWFWLCVNLCSKNKKTNWKKKCELFGKNSKDGENEFKVIRPTKQLKIREKKIYVCADKRENFRG